MLRKLTATLLLLVVGVVPFSIPAASYAATGVLSATNTGGNSGDDAERVGGSDNTTAAQNQLHADVAKKIAGKKYALEGGGTVSGNNLLGTNGKISEAVYGRLSREAKNQFTNDIVTANMQLTDPSREDYDQTAATKPYDKSTAIDWLRDLQRQGGMGSAMLTALMAGTSPDLVGAHAVLQPFNGPVNLILGILSILILMLLGIVILIDLLYINIPFFQSVVDSKSQSDSAVGRVFSVSAAARKAVAEAEQSGKEPLWYYIRKKIVQFFALGLALLYLVMGQLWTLVGTGIDLVSGFTN